MTNFTFDFFMIVSYRGICTRPKDKALQSLKTAENNHTPTFSINSKFCLLLVQVVIYFDIGLCLNIHMWKIFGKIEHLYRI